MAYTKAEASRTELRKATVGPVPNEVYKFVTANGQSIRANAEPAPNIPVQVPCGYGPRSLLNIPFVIVMADGRAVNSKIKPIMI